MAEQEKNELSDEAKTTRLLHGEDECIPEQDKSEDTDQKPFQEQKKPLEATQLPVQGIKLNNEGQNKKQHFEKEPDMTRMVLENMITGRSTSELSQNRSSTISNNDSHLTDAIQDHKRSHRNSGEPVLTKHISEEGEQPDDDQQKNDETDMHEP